MSCTYSCVEIGVQWMPKSWAFDFPNNVILNCSASHQQLAWPQPWLRVSLHCTICLILKDLSNITHSRCLAPTQSPSPKHTCCNQHRMCLSKGCSLAIITAHRLGHPVALWSCKMHAALQFISLCAQFSTVLPCSLRCTSSVCKPNI